MYGRPAAFVTRASYSENRRSNTTTSYQRSGRHRGLGEKVKLCPKQERQRVLSATEGAPQRDRRESLEALSHGRQQVHRYRSRRPVQPHAAHLLVAWPCIGTPSADRTSRRSRSASLAGPTPHRSVGEVMACLQVAEAWGYVRADAIADVLAPCDRVLATCWRLGR